MHARKQWSPWESSGKRTKARRCRRLGSSLVLLQAWMIFIVDEDDSVRRGLSRLMRASGPRMSGLQIQLRLKEQGIDLPVIAVSARDDDETRSTARTLGARFFLRKPVDDRALLDAIAWVTGARV